MSPGAPKMGSPGYKDPTGCPLCSGETGRMGAQAGRPGAAALLGGPCALGSKRVAASCGGGGLFPALDPPRSGVLQTDLIVDLSYHLPSKTLSSAWGAPRNPRFPASSSSGSRTPVRAHLQYCGLLCAFPRISCVPPAAGRRVFQR